MRRVVSEREKSVTALCFLSLGAVKKPWSTNQVWLHIFPTQKSLISWHHFQRSVTIELICMVFSGLDKDVNCQQMHQSCWLVSMHCLQAGYALMVLIDREVFRTQLSYEDIALVWHVA